MTARSQPEEPIISGDLWGDLEEYWSVLRESKLAEKSVEDYYYFAMCFIRWVEGSFVPGENL
jgi:hypothetical protein